MTESLIQPTRFGRDGKKTHSTTLVRVIRLTALQTVDGYASCAEYKVYADKRMLEETDKSILGTESFEKLYFRRKQQESGDKYAGFFFAQIQRKG